MKPKDCEKTIVAIGRRGYGFGDSVAEAVGNCRPNCDYPTDIAVFLCHEDTEISLVDGSLQCPKHTPPIEIDRKHYKTPSSRPA